MMIALMRLTVIDGKRLLKSFRFWGTILLICVVMSISTYRIGEGAIDIINLCSIGVCGSGTFLLTMCILPTLPYSASYSSDNISKATRQWSIRSGIVPYAISKFVVSFVSGMAAYLMGMILYIVIASIKLPLFVDITVDDSYSQLLIAGKPMQYLVCYLLHYSLSAALFAGCAFFISTLIPNAFVATATPVVLYFLYMRICNFISMPDAYTAVNLVQAICRTERPAEALLTKGSSIIIISLILCISSTIVIRRRSMNE